MEELQTKKKGGKVCLVFAIIFSVLFVPMLLVLVPAGGAAITVSSMVSQKSIEEVIDEARISEEIYDVLLEEIGKEADTGFLKPEVIEDIAGDSIRQKDVDKIVDLFVDCVYNDKTKDVDLSDVEERLTDSLTTICYNSFDDLYSAWMYDTTSKYFTEEYKHVFFGELENNLFSEYASFNASSLYELEQEYDWRYGYGAYDDMVSRRILSKRGDYESWIEDKILDGVSSGIEEAELTIKDTIESISGESDLRKGIDVAKTVGDSRVVIAVIAYGAIFGMVIILLLLYKFKLAGFLVTSIPLLIGGIGCKVIGLAERVILSWIDNDVISKIVEEEQYQNIIYGAFRTVVEKLFGGVSGFGTVMLIAGGVLLATGIVLSVLRKHIGKSKEECPAVNE